MTQRTARYQIFILIVAQILLSEAASFGGSTKPGEKQPELKKSTVKKSRVQKAASSGLLAEESLRQQYFTSPFIQNLISSHENANSVGSGWYGFQHFIPRQSRVLNGRSSREESLYVLGEKRPTTPSSSSFVHRERERATTTTQPQQQEYQYIQYESSVPEEKEGDSENTLPLINPQILRSPLPVTLRIIPLKMTSQEIAQALQKMHWLPVPMRFGPQFGNAGREQEVHGQPVYEMHHQVGDETEEDTPMYHDRSFSEPSYPPPSSHVATPLENPPAITYDRGMSFESYDGTSYHPRTFSKA